MELMRLAIEAASRAGREVRPNPKVGCALRTTSGQTVVSFHQKCGEAHAERRVLEMCEQQGLNTQGAVVAVTLEPCSHSGRTGPCADALIQARVAEVFVGSEDPFPQVRGAGIKKLQNAGIQVTTGVLNKECEALNREWLFAHRQGRAYLTLKMATSLDGKWRSEKGQSKWITSKQAREDAQQLRHRVDAILTSSTTVAIDKPRMTARDADGNDITQQPELFVWSQAKEWTPESFLKLCYQQNLYDVMLEAGPTLSQIFMEAGMVDEIWHYVESQYLGGQALGFPQAFSEGNLPGLYFEFQSIEKLGPTSLRFVLESTRR
jgi:diaminohydroxyphosphoribosylaminopyrimidine deaminase / 5-amino-6-(5-phosphoribosylamino)uracil reductase